MTMKEGTDTFILNLAANITANAGEIRKAVDIYKDSIYNSEHNRQVRVFAKKIITDADMITSRIEQEMNNDKENL